MAHALQWGFYQTIFYAVKCIHDQFMQPAQMNSHEWDIIPWHTMPNLDPIDAISEVLTLKNV